MQRRKRNRDKFIWRPEDIVPLAKKISKISLSASVLEFYNKCNSSTDGKFCSTAGGNKKGTTAAQRATAAKKAKAILATEAKDGTVKVKSGSHTPVAKGGGGGSAPAPKKAAPASKPKASVVKSTPKPAAKPAPEKVVTVPKKTAEKVAPKKTASKKDEENDKVTVPKKTAEKAGVAEKATPGMDPDVKAIHKKHGAAITKPADKMTEDEVDKVTNDMFDDPKLTRYDFFHKMSTGHDKHSLFDTVTETEYMFKPGESIADAVKSIKALSKGKPKINEVEEDDYFAEAKKGDDDDRIITIANERKSRLGKNSLAHHDISNGAPTGMNQLPPPAGTKKAKLSDDEVAALVEYRGENHKIINKGLRGQVKKSKAVDEVVADLDSAFAKAPVTTKDITVYRGTAAKLTKGDFKDNGFTSTTYDEGAARDFGDTVIKIVIPKGTPVLKLSGGGKEGHYGGESELLLPRGSEYARQPDGSYIVNVAKVAA